MTDQTQTTTEPVLLPCPFCGGEAWLNDYEAKHSDLPPHSRAPQCRSCGVSPGYLPTTKKAIAAWNTRTTPQPLAIGLDREAVARVQKFLAEWAKGSHKGNEIYCLHTGSDREAELTVTDLRSLLALAAPAVDVGALVAAAQAVLSQHDAPVRDGKTKERFEALRACLPAAPTGGRS